MARKYLLIFPTKTFETTSLRNEKLQEVIVLKNNMQKFILLDEDKKRGRIYWGKSKELDFEIVRVK